MQRRLPGRGGLRALGKERRKDFPEKEDDMELYYTIETRVQKGRDMCFGYLVCVPAPHQVLS